MNILLAQALFTLDLLEVENLPNVAIDALVVGMDSSALRVLAGLSLSELSEAPELFVRSLKELNLPILTRSEAARTLASIYSKQILSGEISPEYGANMLWNVSVMVNDPNFHELDAFIYSSSELQTRPEDRDLFYGQIIEEAKAWASIEQNT